MADKIDWRSMFKNVVTRMREAGESQEMGARWFAAEADNAVYAANAAIIEERDRLREEEQRLRKLALDYQAHYIKLDEALKPFSEAARNFTFAIAPDGIDDGIAVIAYAHGRLEYEVVLTTADFSRAAASRSNDPCFSIVAGIKADLDREKEARTAIRGEA